MKIIESTFCGQWAFSAQTINIGDHR